MSGCHLSVNDLHIFLSESDVGGISVSIRGINDLIQDSFITKVALTCFLLDLPKAR